MIRTKFPKKEQHTAGRKGHFQTEFIRQVYYLALLGARDQDIADFFKVNITTIDYWKMHRPDFMEAMKQGKWEYDFKVVKTLGRRALGYSVTEKEFSEHLTRTGDVIILTKTTEKHILPDVTAIIFWLKNRQRALWADVNKTEISGSIDHRYGDQPLDFSSLSKEEQRLVRSIALKKLSNTNGISSN